MTSGGGTGMLLLQGGAEFGAGCREMDGDLLEGGPAGPVVILLGAATPGDDHDRAARRASSYYGTWDREVVVTPHPQVDSDACAEAVGAAAVVVLPGGSPSRLLDSLLLEGGLVADAVRGVLDRGGSVSGASAGSMVLCDRVVLPDRDGDVVDGLGLVPGLALPHYSGAAGSWTDASAPEGPRWGLPECGGVLVVDGTVRATGAGTPVLLRGVEAVELGRSAVLLSDLGLGVR